MSYVWKIEKILSVYTVEKYYVNSEGENWGQKEIDCLQFFLGGPPRKPQLLSAESVFETPQKVRKDCKRQSDQETRKKK